MKESNHQPFGGGVFKTLCAPCTPSSKKKMLLIRISYGCLLVSTSALLDVLLAVNLQSREA